MADQLDMFPAARRRTAIPRVEAAPEEGTRLETLAASTAPGLRLGTCGWAFPGWQGLVYAREHGPAQLEDEGLAAYAAHPLLSTVTLKRTRHSIPTADVLAAYRTGTPADFRFVAYVPYSSACASFGRGGANPDFLSPPRGAQQIEALLEGLGDRVGVVLLELPKVDPAAYGGRKTIPDRLHRFLDALPPGPSYAVQPHDHKWLTPAYAAALRDVGSTHCLAVHPSAPPLARQIDVATEAEAPRCVIRWSLGPRFDYESTERFLEPYDARCRPDERTLEEIGAIVKTSLAAQRPTWVLIDNRAEGCAPRSLEALATMLAP